MKPLVELPAEVAMVFPHKLAVYCRGPPCLEIFWSHFTNTATVSETSNILQHDVGNCLGLHALASLKAAIGCFFLAYMVWGCRCHECEEHLPPQRVSPLRQHLLGHPGRPAQERALGVRRHMWVPR